jgi:hypothetical protein
MIKGSAVMGFTKNPKQCLEDAAGDLQSMGCLIFYKKCQEVDTISTQILIGVPNTIEEEVIKNTLDKKLMEIEQDLLTTDTAYKLTREQSKNWIRFAVVREYPMGMPWEGIEEKKQKQGTTSACLACGLHVHRPDYKCLKTLLAHAKEKSVWDNIWGKTTYMIETPEDKDPIGVKNKYIQMIQSHGSVQLSIGAATIEGMLDVDTVFELCLLPDAKGNPRQQTKTTIKEIFSMMTFSNPNPKPGQPLTHKVWICLSTGTNGMMTGYFSSVVPEIQDHVAAFTMCPAAQVYWWLCQRGYLTEDVNRLIRHCYTISQQQKVTKSKYMKDLGHAVVNDQDADNIINAAATQGIFDLTLGLSNKEKRTMAIGKIHNASTITLGKAKEGSMEAYNFSSVQLVTSTHSTNEKKKAAKTNASVRSLAKFVYSIDTGTSKVTAEDTDEEMDNSEDESSSYSTSAEGR